MSDLPHRHRVVAFSNSTKLSGAPRALISIVRTLRSHDIEVVVVVRRNGPLVPLLREAGADVRRHPMPPWLARKASWPLFAMRAVVAVACLPRLWWLVRRLDPCAAYTNSMVTPEGAIAARMAGVPHIWHLREYVPGNETLRGRLPFAWIVRAIESLSTVRIAVSESVAGQFGGKGAAAQVVHAGIDEARFVGEAPLPHPWLHEGSPALAVVGTLSVAKGTLLAVDVLTELHRDFPQCRLLLVGSGAPRFKRRLQRRIDELGLQHAVRIDDFTDDVRTVFAAADALLVPSRHEAYGLVTVEALGAGVPVIGSASGATEDLLKGGAGLLANPEKPAEFADRVRALLDDQELRARLTAVGRQRAEALRPDAEANAVREALDAVCRLRRQSSES